MWGMKKLFALFLLGGIFVVQPVHSASELANIQAQIKKTEQQNKKLEQQVKSSSRQIESTKKELVKVADRVSTLLILKICAIMF